MVDLDTPFYRHYSYCKKENRIYAEWFRRHGLSYIHFLVLDSVLRHPEGVEPTELAEEHLIPKQTVTGILDGLEREGRVRRERSERDRRRTRVFILPEGEAFVRRVLGELEEREQAATAAVSPRDMERFNAVYAAIVAGLESRLLDDPASGHSTSATDKEV